MHGKHEIKTAAPVRTRYSKVYRRKAPVRRIVPVAMALVLIFVGTLGGTLAFLHTKSDPVINIFEPSRVSCEITENFDGTYKKNVCVQNTGDTDIYIRVKLMPYYYDKDGTSIVAKSSWSPVFTPSSGWVEGADGFWYYTNPVAPGASTASLIPQLILGVDEITLAHQALEIIASCIQAYPTDAVEEAWSGDNGSVVNVNNAVLNISTSA